MPSLKRRVAQAVARASGTMIMLPGEFTGMHERLHLRRLFALLEVDCVFDVGANRGQYARMLRDEVGYAGHIVSYEPQPHLLPGLQAAAGADPLWHIEGVALDRQAGSAKFRVMHGDEFSSLRASDGASPELFADWMRVREEVDVRCETLATELPRLQQRLGFRRPFLKMDTQGHDLAVLEGAADAVRGFVGLQSELAFRRLYDGAPDFAQSIAAYRQAGFELSALVPNNAGHFPVLVEMDCVMLRADLVPETLR